ncbi:MAG TPA: hypothetical protein VG994_15195 [Steroidobacteraceae bacterium]|nr:hypothetical protein [Steroidobacteraceae bacterium]
MLLWAHDNAYARTNPNEMARSTLLCLADFESPLLLTAPVARIASN